MMFLLSGACFGLAAAAARAGGYRDDQDDGMFARGAFIGSMISAGMVTLGWAVLS